MMRGSQQFSRSGEMTRIQPMSARQSSGGESHRKNIVWGWQLRQALLSGDVPEDEPGTAIDAHELLVVRRKGDGSHLAGKSDAADCVRARLER